VSTDAIVIGAGAGGPVVAKELAERGLSVLLLNAGPSLDPDRDYTLGEDDMRSPSMGKLRWGPADRSRRAWARVRVGVGVILQTAAVGGTTLQYNGISPRAFVASVNGDWPLSYHDLIPWYERVEDFLPVKLVDDLATKDALFAEGCEAIGLRRSESRDVSEDVWRPCHNAILPIARMPTDGSGPLRYPEVYGCTMCGHCGAGCPHPVGAPLEHKAKRATNVSYVPAAVATGNCELSANAFATQVLFERNGDGRARARGVRWRDTLSGREDEREAAVVVLASGSIESPRLWLNSGLPNSADVVGRYLTTHLQDLVTGFFHREVHPDVGAISMARADFPGRGTMFSQGFGPRTFALNVAASGQTLWDEPTGDEPWDFAGRAWGEKAARQLEQYSRSLCILISTDDEEHRDNRVTVADEEEAPPDEHGPVPKVIYHATPRSRERVHWLARAAAAILRGAGAHEVHRTAHDPPLLTHIMGTMRMGNDPATSVVNADGEAHEVERLFVGDNSVLPNGLGGANPTLTAQALAARTAKRIAERYFA
jgi:choline dehydrogenase-like flavoprotein